MNSKRIAQYVRLICCFVCITMIGGITACSTESDRVIVADDSTFLVEFKLDCDEDILAIHLKYYLQDTAIGGGAVGHADNSLLTTEDVYTWEFKRSDFPEGAELSDFRIELFIVDELQNEYPCEETIRLQAQYGNTYRVNISGSYGAGFSGQVSGASESHRY